MEVKNETSTSAQENLSTPILIIGAGPFGLSLSACLRDRNVPHIIVGSRMSFWKQNMPKGMILRSATDWHLDGEEIHTFEAFVKSKNLNPGDVEPVTIDFYFEYVEWFQQQKGVEPMDVKVKSVNRAENGFSVRLEDGREISAQKVVLALGLADSRNIPEEYKSFPAERTRHTSELCDLSGYKNQRVLVIGGRQSAFEYAALLSEQGASQVHIAYRHHTPAFAPADWSWVLPTLGNMVAEPTWFRSRSQSEKDALSRRLWENGRLKLEPWLLERLTKDSICLHPCSKVLRWALTRPAELSEEKQEASAQKQEKQAADEQKVEASQQTQEASEQKQEIPSDKQETHEVGEQKLEANEQPREAVATTERKGPATEQKHESPEKVKAEQGETLSITLGAVDAQTILRLPPIDRVVLATGYKMNIAGISMLSSLLGDIAVKNGYPMLDPGFQSSVPGLYFAGFAAVQDFGPFFGFTAAVTTGTAILAKQLEG